MSLTGEVISIFQSKIDPEDIKEGIAETPEESKERLTRSDMTKGSDKA